ATPTLDTVGTVTYYAESVDGNNCTSLTRTAVTLTIQGAPVAPTSDGDIEECEQDPIQTLTAGATAPAGARVVWYDAAMGGTAVAIPTLDTVGTVTYYAESVDGNNCTSLTRTAVTLTIHGAPTPPISGGDIIECEQDPIQTLTASVITPLSSKFEWYDAPVGGNIVVNPILNRVGSVTYYAQTETDKGCISLSRTAVRLEITPVPEAPTSSGDITVCEELPSIQSIVANATAPAGSSVVWYDAAIGGNIIADPVLSSVGKITYYAESVASNACNSLTRTPVQLEIIANSLCVDSDGDGVPDAVDLDDDNDGILDTVEEDGDPDRDTDNDGIPDRLDLDSDNDGITDLIESGQDASVVDINQDGILDSTVDSDSDGVMDVVDNENGTVDPVDTDGDGIPDFQDIDSDNDGLSDLVESGSDASLDADNDGMVDAFVDSDGDGIADVFDLDSGGTIPDLPDTDSDGIPDHHDLDSDNDGVNDVIEIRGSDSDNDGHEDSGGLVDGDNLIDTDGDGTPDIHDTDDDGDGILTAEEDLDFDGDPTNDDSDNDGIPDYLDIDDDGDGINTIDESPDLNGDGIPDDALDTDLDGIPDYLDVETYGCLTVYNEFTPNGDGYNDTFVITCITDDKYKNNTLEIYNRWGNLVYSKMGYDNTWTGISNGRFNIKKDKMLPTGTYFYFLDLGNGIKPKSGWVYISRE
ncbi:gliding motility-associated C-terminal domain-containing protein, partial [Tenacibaculum sp. SG-28]|uniref:Ig-like domain-containing protein n=1 Tax=Tenacibaculum sp. SG-28 TaxID=754426 RepID=UPI000CF3F694